MQPAKTTSAPDTFLGSLPAWLEKSFYGLLLVFIAALPLLYDSSVPEVSGDIRWSAGHTTALLGFIFLIFGAIIKRQKLTVTLPPVAWAVFGFGVCVVLSLPDTLSPIRSWQFAQHWLSYIGLFFLFFWVRSAKFQHALFWILTLGLTFNLILGVIQYHDLTDEKINALLSLWPESWTIVNTLKGTFLQSAIPGATFANKNLAASYTVMLWPLVAYLALTSPQRWQKIFCAVTLNLAFIFLLYSRSRASWIAGLGALILGLIYLILTPKWRHAAKQCLKKPLFYLLTGIILTSTFYLGNLPSPLNTHGINRNAAEQLSTLARFDNTEFGPRLAYNLNSLKIIQDHPFNGTGIGTFHTAYPNYHNAYYATPRHGYNVMARPQRAHNDVMQIFTEIGLIGGSFFLSLWFFAAYMTWRLGRTDTSTGHHPILPLFLFTGITGMSLNALADFPLQMPTGPMLLFILLAILSSLYVRVYPPKTYTIPFKTAYLRPFWLLLLFGFFFLFTLILKDNIAYRNGAQQLKFAMQRMQFNVIDTTTLKHLDQSYAFYPYNPRLLEFRAIAFQNFQGTPPRPRHEILATTNEALAQDPYAPNHHINLANMYIRQAIFAQKLNDTKAFNNHISSARQHYTLLLRTAPFSHFTYGIEGTLAFLENNKPAAITAFQRALQIQPQYAPARDALKQLNP